MRRRALMIGVMGVTIVAVGLALVFLWLPGSDTRSPPGPGVGSSDRQADAVFEALLRLESAPDELVARSAREHVGQDARGGVPAGSTVAVDRESWQPDGIGGGTIVVTVTPPGQEPQPYMAVMVEEPGGWKVIGSLPLASDTEVGP